MKKCPKCGTETDQKWICPNCGEMLIDEKEKGIAQRTDVINKVANDKEKESDNTSTGCGFKTNNDSETNSNNNPIASKKKNKAIIIAGVAFAVVVILILIGVISSNSVEDGYYDDAEYSYEDDSDYNEEETTEAAQDKNEKSDTTDDGSITYSRSLSYNEKVEILTYFNTLPNETDAQSEAAYDETCALYDVTEEDIMAMMVDCDGDILKEACKNASY